MIQPKQLPQQAQPPSRERLELMLRNGPDMIDIVKGFIDKFELPYLVLIADGSSSEVPAGNGILKDTLSQGELHLQKFITEEPTTLLMKEHARKVSRTQHEVLIIGDSGTGKEIIAKSMIADRKGVIKAVNCAGFPETLIESELFGYVRGAFTGADTTRNGLMTEAADGVMFLDEVGELPLVMQAKLLRAIQEKRIRKVGSNKDEDINCKFVFATNRNLKAMVKENTFRKDLYARISTLELNILPLWPIRKCDLVPICKSIHGGDKFLAAHEDDLMQGLLGLDYNVRSLQQYIIRYNVLGSIK